MDMIWAAVIGGGVTSGIAVVTATWMLGRTIGGLRRDVQEHGDALKENGRLLRNGLSARIAENAKSIAVLMEHQKSQDAALERCTQTLDRIEERMDALPCYAAPRVAAGCD